jgi:hypothetical protein
MLKIWNADNFRRTLAGLCLIAAPLLYLVSEWIGPESSDDATRQLALISEQPTLWAVGALLDFLAAILFVPATLGLIHLLSGRGAILGHVGGGLMLLAQLGSAALVGLDLALLEISDEGADRGQMIALAERMMGSAGFTILLLVALFGSFLGLAFLAAGLWRARVVPAWPSVLILLFVVMEFTVIGVSEVLESVALVLLAIGLGWVGIKVLSMSDAEWHEASVGTDASPRVR